MNRWFFWVLAPVMLATAIGLPWLDAAQTWQSRLITAVLSTTLILATLGLANAQRFRWALNGVAIAILFAYSAYLVSEVWQWSNGLPLSSERSDFLNAVRGFIVFGVPSIIFLLKGRSGSAVDVLLARPSPEPQPTSFHDERFDDPRAS